MLVIIYFGCRMSICRFFCPKPPFLPVLTLTFLKFILRMEFCRKQKQYQYVFITKNLLSRKDMKNRSKTDIVRITLLLCTLFVVSTLFGGCALLNGAPGETKSEVRQKHSVIVKTQKKQIQDDWNSVLLLNKPSKLSDRYVR